MRPRARIEAKARLVANLDLTWTEETLYGPIKFWCYGPGLKGASVKRDSGEAEWIDGFAEGETLWAVDAGVGASVLYAAAKGHRVVAFAQELESYYVLSHNVAMNGFGGLVTINHNQDMTRLEPPDHLLARRWRGDLESVIGKVKSAIVTVSPKQPEGIVEMFESHGFIHRTACKSQDINNRNVLFTRRQCGPFWRSVQLCWRI